MQETWVRSLGGEDPLEKEMATNSSIRAWESPWTEEPGGLQSKGGHKRVGHNLVSKQQQSMVYHERARALLICDKSLNPPNSTLKMLLSAQQPFSGG